jgi:hypothetical protein
MMMKADSSIVCLEQLETVEENVGRKLEGPRSHIVDAVGGTFGSCCI